jgi:hypothetical protein
MFFDKPTTNGKMTARREIDQRDTFRKLRTTARSSWVTVLEEPAKEETGEEKGCEPRNEI